MAEKQEVKEIKEEKTIPEDKEIFFIPNYNLKNVTFNNLQ